MLLNQGPQLLDALARMLANPSDVLRAGAAATVKNLCVSAERDGTMGAIRGNATLLSALLVRI